LRLTCSSIRGDKNMTVPYVGHLNARARFHVQVELTRVPSECKTPGAVPVLGRVVRVFRGNSILSIGDQLTLRG
jgi:hypothetical protein